MNFILLALSTKLILYKNNNSTYILKTQDETSANQLPSKLPIVNKSSTTLLFKSCIFLTTFLYLQGDASLTLYNNR